MARKRKEPKRSKCENCNERFTLQKPWQKFCSADCRNDWHCERRTKAMRLLEEQEREQS